VKKVFCAVAVLVLALVTMLWAYSDHYPLAGPLSFFKGYRPGRVVDWNQREMGEFGVKLTDDGIVLEKAWRGPSGSVGPLIPWSEVSACARTCPGDETEFWLGTLMIRVDIEGFDGGARLRTCNSHHVPVMTPTDFNVMMYAAIDPHSHNKKAAIAPTPPATAQSTCAGDSTWVRGLF